MVEQPYDKIYRIQVPLPKSPLKAVNAYVIKGDTRNLVVDTGMNRPVCREALASGFQKLALDPDRTDFFITHFHSDHLGLASRFASDRSRVYFNRREADFIKSEMDNVGFVGTMVELARKAGFPQYEIEQSLEQHPGLKYGAKKNVEFEVVDDGDTLEAGPYGFVCISTPGHTMGHTCLYEPREKLLLSGDHVLWDITPNISAWTGQNSPLDDYLASLDRIRGIDVSLVLPGHRNVFTDCRGRIDSLKQHHQARADEVLRIVRSTPATAYDIASRMSWDIAAQSWDDFPIVQKWFAVGEALTHLKHLERKGAVTPSENPCDDSVPLHWDITSTPRP